ncbi:hypothetical protein F2P56_008432 [Juglans regia]|uniref:Uncharacterized protein LOC109006745 n=2 Tax=Juglans regia TaxID=51240 RepID=A0A2I4GCS9_JUGRE|nr:uncharacterized protein LOC109006745 [Juglans regia]KAF5471658.1 hypothetical protein F2P56_008432 [Juglans regia]
MADTSNKAKPETKLEPVQITNILLKEANFLRWSQSVWMYIRGIGKIWYLTGETKEPEKTDPSHVIYELQQKISNTHQGEGSVTRHTGGGKVAILIVYVNDIILTSDDNNELERLKKILAKEFEIKDLGNLKYFLGPEHFDAVYIILRYLKGTPGKGLLFGGHGNRQVEIYTDADWAGSVTDRRSTSGYCTFVGGNLVTWHNKKQNVVARSSAEARPSLGLLLMEFVKHC